MSLEDFRAIANERTRHLTMTPELERKILRNCQKPRSVGRHVWVAAAACFVLMVISGVALMGHMGAEPRSDVVITAQLPQAGAPQAHRTVVESPSEAVQVNDGVQQDASAKGIDLSALSKPAAIGEYSEGYAPAQNEEGLWGYVDADGEWVLPPVYAQVAPVKNLQATVTRTDGKTATALFQAAQ